MTSTTGTVDWAVGLQLDAGDDRYHLRIESPFVVHTGDTERLVVPEIPPTARVVLGLLRQHVVRLEAFDDGHLELQLAESLLSIPATEDHEP